jgi:hypothetical protein
MAAAPLSKIMPSASVAIELDQNVQLRVMPPSAHPFGPFAADETIVGVDIYDAPTNGNLLFGAILAYTATYSAGQSFDWNVGHLWAELGAARMVRRETQEQTT